ncbi:hypothetical protein ACIPLR_24920 [Herbaspirillum huttiense]|uniref:hypothetical protein n=1 Tax=Herbaspirillum TaxID=963 RepID=UPI00098110CC|nr:MULTISPECIES: hypothetical protein [unclassified Herbaspirillum]MRT30998.1 hypothetical protein [Herbaspirillum sp. CAH-3]ONN63809.1 hypothetical protein BTM36_25580 [Herbaspirillum sp. VT-16-41]
MSDSKSTNLTNREDVAARIIAEPFLIIGTAAKIVTQSATAIFKRPPKVEKVETERVVLAASGPLVTANPVFTCADRTQSVIRGGTKLSLYQYVKLQQIRIVARRDGFEKELIFTRDIAAQEGLAYNLDNAVVWVTRKGFVGAPAPTVPTARQQMPRQIQTSPVKGEPEEESRELKDLNKSPSPAGVTKTSNVHRTYHGFIQRFGVVKKHDHEKNQDYQTYAMSLETSAGKFLKEFIGEQLSDLVELHKLSVGQEVSITPLGKQHFWFDLGNGKKEKRRRNEYAIEIH